MPDNLAVITATQKWLNTFIIPHNICPFAKKVVDEQKIRFTVQTANTIESALFALIAECELLDNQIEIETSLLIYPELFSDFDAYLDFLEIANDLLIEQGYEGVYQLASFHPHYCFDGVTENDASNYTNRSPYAMLHLIREQSIEQVLQYYVNPEAIPERNIALTRTFGLSVLQQLLADCYQ
jgi:hypothetical protein